MGIRLDQALVARKMCESRSEAQECIKGGFVFVDGILVTKVTRIVDESASLEVTQRRRFVSRGGDKLEGVILDVYKTENLAHEALQNKDALDIGSSTGGFTDCLLRYGVSSVVCVDVGTSQLHTSLRKDTRVSLFENMDIRSFSTEKKFDVIVGDVSFIAMEKIIEKILSFGTKETIYFLLIKPQFEVGFGNTKKGIVKDMGLVNIILNKYESIFHEKNLISKIFPSKIIGGDGNQEYFLYIKP